MKKEEIVNDIYKFYGTDSGVLLGIKEKSVVDAIVEFTIRRMEAQPTYNTGKGDPVDEKIFNLIESLCENLALQLSMRGCCGEGDGKDRKGDADSYGGNELLSEAKVFLSASALNTGKGGVWVKASDMLPPIQTPVVIKDSNGTKYIDSAYTGWDKRITDYEWLDESTSSPISVGDGWADDLLRELDLRRRSIAKTFNEADNSYTEQYCKGRIEELDYIKRKLTIAKTPPPPVEQKLNQ